MSAVHEVPDATPVPPAPPKKGRTGLIVALVIAAVLLLGGCGVGAYLVFRAATSDSTSTTTVKPAVKAADAKAETAAAFAFLKGMGTGDVELFKTVMPAETVKTVPKETWNTLLTDAAADPTTFGPLVWSGEQATVDFSASDGSKGTMGFKTSGTDLVVVTLKPDAGESEDATLTVAKDGGRWTVTVLETIDGVLEFDPESVKAMGR